MPLRASIFSCSRHFLSHEKNLWTQIKIVRVPVQIPSPFLYPDWYFSCCGSRHPCCPHALPPTHTLNSVTGVSCCLLQPWPQQNWSTATAHGIADVQAVAKHCGVCSVIPIGFSALSMLPLFLQHIHMNPEEVDYSIRPAESTSSLQAEG